MSGKPRSFALLSVIFLFVVVYAFFMRYLPGKRLPVIPTLQTSRLRSIPFQSMTHSSATCGRWICAQLI